MSLKAVVELVLHVESYHIVEYPHQGLFTFHFTVYQLREGHKRYAIPYQILPNTHPQPSENYNRSIVEPNLDDQAAVTSTCLAKYSDEEILVDNWFTFRMELEGYPELETEEIFIDAELRLNHQDLSEPELPGLPIETVTFRVNDIQNGIFNYVEANFQSPYISELNFTVFSFISSFKFSKYQPVKKELQQFDRQRLSVKTVSGLPLLSKLHLPKQTKIPPLFYSNYVKKLRISQYLIAERLTSILLAQPEQASQIKLPQEFKAQIEGEHITSKEFKEYLDNFQPKDESIEGIMQEINDIKEENFDYLQKVVGHWMAGEVDHGKMVVEFQSFGREKYGEMVFRSVVDEREEQGNVKLGKGKKKGEEGSSVTKSYHENKKIARQMRGKNIILNNYPIEDVRFIEKRQEQELIFYEITLNQQEKQQEQELERKSIEKEKEKSRSRKRQAVLQQQEEDLAVQLRGLEQQYSQKHMLVVLCHGYQGSSYDMSLIKRWIQMQLPDAYYLISKSNEYDTDGDIKAMGQLLAEQIQKYIKNYLEEYEQENIIINLVGHSMGGIIARSAIPHLQKYRHQMGFFCSLSSPHLGYLNGVSGLIKVGMWAIRKFKNIESLSQLSMEERGDPRKTFLYELAQTGHLRYFRKVILLSSFEDSYVSWHSARISTHRSSNSLSQIEQEMVNMILGECVFARSLHRIDINFNVKEKTLDSFIGRTAHINLIVRENLFKTLGVTIPKLFDLTEFGRAGLFL